MGEEEGGGRPTVWREGREGKIVEGGEGGGECGGRGRVWRKRDRVEGESGG